MSGCRCAAPDTPCDMSGWCEHGVRHVYGVCPGFKWEDLDVRLQVRKPLGLRVTCLAGVHMVRDVSVCCGHGPGFKSEDLDVGQQVRSP